MPTSERDPGCAPRRRVQYGASVLRRAAQILRNDDLQTELTVELMNDFTDWQPDPEECLRAGEPRVRRAC